MARYPLIHVHQRCAADPTARDTIATVAGLPSEVMPLVMDEAAHLVASRTGCDRTLILASLSWHVEDDVHCGAWKLTAAAEAIADAVIDLMTTAPKAA